MRLTDGWTWMALGYFGWLGREVGDGSQHLLLLGPVAEARTTEGRVIWVPLCSEVARFDPVTGKRIERPFPLSLVNGLTADSSGLWVLASSILRHFPN